MDKTTVNNKVVICPVCSKETEVRFGIFAHDTLNRHLKEHKKEA